MRKKARVTCPNCGYENRAKAVQCNLCHELMPVAVTTGAIPPVPQAPPTSQPLAGGFDLENTAAFTGDQAADGEREGSAEIATTRRSSFYEQQEQNKRNSDLLLFGLVFILTLLGAVIGAGVMGDPVAGAMVAFVLACFLGLYSLMSGKNLVMSMSGAKRITHNETPQLFNIVEEMKIASGLPMPEVYYIDSPAPNAFATGRDPDHSAIAVTRGLMEKLNRDELQGVIAHEMSHIRNFDIRYAMLAGVLVGSIALISDAFLRGGSRGGRGGSAPLMILAIALAIIAPISAYMMQMAISRRREFLADASAVELTRNPDGLASALSKIALDPEPLKAANRATQHMYIINPVKNFSMKSGSLMSTHPPTEARIRALRRMGASMR